MCAWNISRLPYLNKIYTVLQYYEFVLDYFSCFFMGSKKKQSLPNDLVRAAGLSTMRWFSIRGSGTVLELTSTSFGQGSVCILSAVFRFRVWDEGMETLPVVGSAPPALLSTVLSYYGSCNSCTDCTHTLSGRFIPFFTFLVGG